MAAQRTHEVYVRVALGAHPADIMRLVLAEALRLGVARVPAVVASALVLTRVMGNLLYRVTFIAVGAMLVGVALASIRCLRCETPDQRPWSATVAERRANRYLKKLKLATGDLTSALPTIRPK